ncbi:Na+/H+ antiporter subunit E [Serpentinicella alkaliphila]|uniref:Multisubunit sodium/proton antiporter MrpE subunit n=1 Tax=Serpentinicella alkaliphila TaxID=1734049 RepID=A0A4R2TSE6_9FIRM|nr:Na+/H+ antiporter subunit E [Serpentinicella alkaliphila]QUH25648.1 Na+/H+ antiporter subunit E [Serpentinicella alkaliphila]TCQ06641.1 multisubunit sodium/proton antiporter MrpE subunit [Serpentinicella alkaliphila]
MKSKYNVILFILLITFWIILTPIINFLSVLIGAVISLLIVLYSRDIAFKDEEMPDYTLINLITYLKFILILIVEIIKSNISVAKIVLNPSLPLSPCFVKVPVKFKNDVLNVIFANAVTLTPGTITVDMQEDGFIIHALTKEAAEGMTNSVIEQYCRRLEDGGIKNN